MGQYHKIVNLDKKCLISPPDFTDGMKLGEFSGGGLTMVALTALLAISNGRGGGDFQDEFDSSLIGSWAGDRIAIVGDYWEDSDAVEFKKENGVFVPTWEMMHDEPEDDGFEEHVERYENISWDILEVIIEDDWYKGQLLSSVARYDWGKDWSRFFTKKEIEAEKKKQEAERANNSN